MVGLTGSEPAVVLDGLHALPFPTYVCINGDICDPTEGFADRTLNLRTMAKRFGKKVCVVLCGVVLCCCVLVLCVVVLCCV